VPNSALLAAWRARVHLDFTLHRSSLVALQQVDENAG